MIEALKVKSVDECEIGLFLATEKCHSHNLVEEIT